MWIHTDFSTGQLSKGNNKRSPYFVLFRTGQELLAILDGDPFGVLESLLWAPHPERPPSRRFCRDRKLLATSSCLLEQLQILFYATFFICLLYITVRTLYMDSFKKEYVGRLQYPWGSFQGIKDDITYFNINKRCRLWEGWDLVMQRLMKSSGLRPYCQGSAHVWWGNEWMTRDVLKEALWCPSYYHLFGLPGSVCCRFQKPLWGQLSTGFLGPGGRHRTGSESCSG